MTNHGKRIRGIWRFYETCGVPLSLILSYIFACGRRYPDWAELYLDMRRSGKRCDRAFGMIREAIADAGYPRRVSEALHNGVVRMENAINLAEVNLVLA